MPDTTLTHVEESRRRRALATIRSHWFEPHRSQSLHAWALEDLELAASMVTMTRSPTVSTRPSKPTALQPIGSERSLDGRIAVTGDLGMGKTTHLALLVERALERAQSDPMAPLPLPLNLQSWEPDSELEDWIALEAFLEFRFPIEVVRNWINNGRLALALDGIDELPEVLRVQCWSAIERFRIAFPTVPLWMSVSHPTAGELSQLDAADVVTLGPLRDDELEPLLVADEARGGWLRAAGEEAPSLAECLRRPVCLNLAVLGHDPESSHHRRTAELDPQAFLDRMRMAKPAVELEILSGVARAMSQFRLASLRPSRATPQWLQTAWSRSVYRAMGFSMAFLAGFAVGLLVDWLLEGVVRGGLAAQTSAWWLQAGLVIGILLAVAEAVAVQLGSSTYLPLKRDAIYSWLVSLVRLKLIPRLVIAAVVAGAVWVGYLTFGGVAFVVALAAGISTVVRPIAKPVPALRWSWPSFLRKVTLRIGLASAIGAVIAIVDYPMAGVLFAGSLTFAAGLIGGFIAGFKKHIPDPDRPSLVVERAVTWNVLAVFGGILLTGIGYGAVLNHLASADQSTLSTGLMAAGAVGVVATAITAWHYGILGAIQRWLAARIAARQFGLRARYVAALRHPRPGLINLGGQGIMFAHPVVRSLAAGETVTFVRGAD